MLSVAQAALDAAKLPRHSAGAKRPLVLGGEPQEAGQASNAAFPEETRVFHACQRWLVETRGWVLHDILGRMAQFKESMKKDPPVPLGASDP